MGWEALIYLVISLVISYALAPKTQPPTPEALEDIDIPQIDEGTAQSVVFGDCWVKDWQVLDYGNYKTTPITKGGK